MAEIIKIGHYDADNLASVAFHFGKKGEDMPVLALLEQGASPDTADRFGFTALHRAAQFDRQDVIRALLDAGTDPNRAGKSGATPLMGIKSATAARLLLKAGAEVNTVTVANKSGMSVGKTALMYAAEQGNMEVAAVLLEYGADTRLRNAEGCSALMLAAWNEKSEITRMLLDTGVDVGFAEAALLNDRNQVQTLLAAGADLNPQARADALQWAAVGGHTDIVTILLDNVVPIDAANPHGKTALMQAASYGHTIVMRLLLERGANPNVADHNDRTALLASVHSSTRRNREAVELLLAHGAQANVRSRSGWTPLMLACLWGDAEVVALLLQHGADPAAFTDAEIMAREEGCSTTNALMLAVGNGHIEAVKLLLQYGADPLAQNNDDNTALDTARRGVLRKHKQVEIQEILPLLEAAASNLKK